MNRFRQATGLINMNIKQAITWRFNFLTSLFLYPITLVMYYFLWKSIFAYSGTDIIKGYTFPGMIGYYVIQMVVGMLVWVEVDSHMSNQIRKGKMTQKLLRPLAYLPHNLIGAIGIKSIEVVFYAIPVIILGIFFFKIQVGISAIYFIPIMLFAYILNFMIAFITGMLAFWMTKISGIISIRRTIVGFLAGAFIPLSFFPQSFQTMSSYLPFQYIQYVPINVFLGKYGALAVGKLLLIQAAWILVLYGIYKIVWKIGINRYTGVSQ